MSSSIEPLAHYLAARRAQYDRLFASDLARLKVEYGGRAARTKDMSKHDEGN
jgi:hypothetical protein